MVAPDGVHLYHLQVPRNAAGECQVNLLGHAVSSDLIHWRELPPAFGPDPERADDNNQPWTGCAIWHDGCARLFYTMRGRSDTANLQAIGLATSPDGMTFTRHPGNPVIVPDRRWYADASQPVPNVLDCRDLMVVKAPDKPGWYGYFATRRPAHELGFTSVIAAAYSTDLTHWEQLPPVFAPEGLPCVEVPDVFLLNGRWYITCLTGLIYGTQRPFSDPAICHGTLYAVADSPLGPFHRLDDDVVLGARSMASPLSVRSFDFEGEKYLLYTDREKVGASDDGAPTFGTLATPKVYGTSGDRLQVRYSDRVERLVTGELPLDYEYLRGPAIAGDWGQIWRMPPVKAQISEEGIILENTSAFSVLPLGVGCESYILEAEVTLRQAAAAGFVLRMDGGSDGDFLRLDCEEQRLHYLEHRFAGFSEERRREVACDRACRLKVVARREHLEIYLDEVLLLTFARYRRPGDGVGLFVDRGAALFRRIRMRQLGI